MENLTPCKYKTVKDIEKPFGIYHYVGQSSCCAKMYKNRITHFQANSANISNPNIFKTMYRISTKFDRLM